MKRFLRSGLVVVAVVASAAGCGAKQFATVTLLVREPAKQTRLEKDTFANLFFGLDNAPLDSVSFPVDVAPRSKPIELGAAAHVLHTELSTGADPKNPTAIGRADPIAIPAIGSPGTDEGIELTAPLLLAKPNVPEAIDASIPTPRTGSAACDDAAGRAWVVGGADGSGNVQKAYAFGLDNLKANTAFTLDLHDEVACDGDGLGDVVALGTVVDAAGGTSTPTAIFGANAAPQPVALGADDGVDPFVQVSGNVVWFASAGSFQVRGLVENHGVIASGNAPVDATAKYMVLDAAHALRFTSAGTSLLTVSGSDIVLTDAGFNNVVVAVDAKHGAVVQKSGATLELVTPVLGAVVSFAATRELKLGGVVPSEILVLPDGRVAGLQRAGGTTPDTVVDIERSAQVHVGNREHMTLTVGGAILLFGGDPGHDVLVAK